MTGSPRSFSDAIRARIAAVVALVVALVVACGALFAGQAHAGQLQVMPTRLVVSVDAPTTTMFATNAESADASYQVSVFSWGQHADGSDQLDPTREVLANPAIFTVKPGEQQIIRFGLRNTQLPDGRSYRVVLQELPRATVQAAGIQALLRISVPIFVPAAKPVTAMRWALRSTAAGGQLLARNEGNVHVQVTGIQIDDAGTQQASIRCSAYVLPGVARAIPVRPARPLVAGTTYHVRIDTDQGPMTADLRADIAAIPPAS
jgi:fimbrial chaperone protein